MALDQDLLFIAEEDDLGVYNGTPILNLPIYFQLDDGTAFNFPGFVSCFLNIYQSRGETQLKSLTTQMTVNSNVMVLNCSALDMTFNDNGKYYYELGYIQSGGYSVILRYGNLWVQ